MRRRRSTTSINGENGFLKDDLLCGGRAGDCGQVATMGGAPVRPAGVVQAEPEPEPEQKRLQSKFRGPEGDLRGVASAAQIPECLVLDGRHIDRR